MSSSATDATTLLHLTLVCCGASLQVKIPITYSGYTSRRVLTTEWLEGEKLSQSTADDVGTLVNVGVICYLKQVRTVGSMLGHSRVRAFGSPQAAYPWPN
jgi:hypothetical protein